MVKLAVVQNGRALQYASKELRGDAGRVKRAVVQNGSALAEASKEMRGEVGAARGQPGWA